MRIGPVVALAIALLGCGPEGSTGPDAALIDWGDPDAAPDANPEAPPPPPPPGVTCDPGFVWDGSACSVGKGSTWDVYVLAATAPAKTAAGLDWDTVGAAPDTYVLLRYGGGGTASTPVATDNYAPLWTDVLVHEARGAELLAGFAVTLYDFDDLNPDDPIGECDLTPLPDELFDGASHFLPDVDPSCPDVVIRLDYYEP